MGNTPSYDNGYNSFVPVYIPPPPPTPPPPPGYNFSALNSLPAIPKIPVIKEDKTIPLVNVSQSTPSLDEGCVKKTTPISSYKLEEIVPPPPPPPPPPLPPINAKFLANDLLDRVYRYLKKNNNNITNTINSANTYSSQNGHTMYDDQRTERELTNRNNNLQSIHNNFENITLNKNIKSDITTILNMVFQIKDYYDVTLPDYHKNIEVDPLKKQIKQIESEIVEYTKKNNFLLKEISALGLSASINKDLLDKVKEYKVKVKKINDIYTAHDVNNKLLLYNGVNTENSAFDNKLNEMKNTATEDDRNTNFLSKHSTTLRNIKTYLFYAYFIVLLVLLYVFFIMNDYNENFKFKVFLILLFISYPFVIEYFEKYLFFVLKMLYSFITVRVYRDYKADYITSNTDYQ
jgi:hypothetical protein